MNIELSQQELYRLVIRYLKQQMALPDPQIQVRGVTHAVDREACFLATGSREGVRYLKPSQDEDITGIVWDLIIQRILNFTEQGYPWIALTAYGKKVVVEDGALLPYDPEGLLENLKKKAPGASALCLEYVHEASLSFRGGAYRAASVMLGVASEEAFLGLVKAFEIKYSKEIIPDKFKPFQQIREDFLKKFNPTRADLPPDLKNNLDSSLLGIFELVKKGRDDSGHPTGITISREEVFANFSVLPHYLERVDKIVAFYRT